MVIRIRGDREGLAGTVVHRDRPRRADCTVRPSRCFDIVRVDRERHADRVDRLYVRELVAGHRADGYRVDQDIHDVMVCVRRD